MLSRNTLLLLLSCAAAPAYAGAPFIGGNSGTIVPATVRNIASAVRVPGFNTALALTNGTNTTQNGRAAFTNASGKDCSAPAIIYSGWYVCNSGACITEAVTPNNYTVTASLEYPAATMTQETWSSSTSKVIAPGANTVGDTMAVTIPAGAQFWVKTHVSVSSGEKWPTSGALWTSELGEIGVGLADKTMSGTISGTTAVLRPSAIVCSTENKISIALLGDSIAAGAGDGNYDAAGNTGGIARGATSLAPMIAMAVSGTKLHDQIATGKLTYRLDLLQKAGITHAITEWGVNDLGVSSEATIEADMVTLWTALNGNGQKPVQTTTTTETTSTDSWQSVANQTVHSGAFSGGASSVRSLINATTRTKPPPLYDYIEIANATETAADSGIFVAGSSYNAHLAPVDSWVVAAGSTTTVVKSNSNRIANYYKFGGAITFTSGVLSGTRATVASNDGSGNITLNSALGSIPDAGTTFTAVPLSVAFTNDGTHPNVTSTSSSYGGHFILRDQTAAKIVTW